jgi:MraZ protein
MPGFVGQYERQVDQKGRLAMPAGYRARFDLGCYLLRGQDGCINVFTPEEFERMAAEVMEKERAGLIERSERRSLFASADLVSLDAQGRINLDERLRRHASVDLGAPVVVAGQWSHVEIWQPERFERQDQAGAERLLGEP